MFIRVVGWVLLQLIVLGYCKENVESDALFLSPLIKSGEVDKARKLAEVKRIYLPSTLELKSYSGFVTVDEEYNSNLFFWFFPASKNWEDAPVVLWSDGGPGVTLLHVFFNLHGPYQFDADNNLELRKSSWNSKFNVIYLDNPVGVGFSFTDKDAGYPGSSQEAAPGVHNFLTQFFKLFPNLKDNAFYNAGSSYGANYATAFAHYIHVQNQKGLEENRINLKGMILDSPWIHPIDQVDFASDLFNTGLIDQPIKTYFDSKRDKMIDLINKGNFMEAAQVIFPYMMMEIPGFAGYNSLNNFVNDKEWTSYYNYTELVTGTPWRKSVHVLDKGYDFVSQEIQAKMTPTFMTSVKPLLEELLDLGYRTLVVSGNLDIITSHVGVQKIVNNLDWKGSKQFVKSDRKIWKSDGRVVGYVKSGENLRYALLRNAGHGCSLDQPESVLKLVSSFISDDEVFELIDAPSIPSNSKKDEL